MPSQVGLLNDRHDVIPAGFPWRKIAVPDACDKDLARCES